MRSLPGIVEVTASYEQGTAVVVYDAAQVTPEQMAEAIRSATYYQVGEPVVGTPVPRAPGNGVRPAANSTAVILVRGMTDNRAASEVLAAMGRPEAIADASVDLAASSVTVQYDGQHVSAETLVAVIDQGTPYEAELVSKSEGVEDATAPARTGDGSTGPNYALWISIGVGGAIVVASGAAFASRRLLGSKPTRAARRRARRR